MIYYIHNWLKNYDGLRDLRVGRVEDNLGGSGMFYRGETLLERHRDLMGKELCRKRMTFRIIRREEPAKAAEFFWQLGQWLRSSAPPLGLDQTVCLRDAHCVRDDGLGLALWEADLEITFTEEEL